MWIFQEDKRTLGTLHPRRGESTPWRSQRVDYRGFAYRCRKVNREEAISPTLEPAVVLGPRIVPWRKFRFAKLDIYVTRFADKILIAHDGAKIIRWMLVRALTYTVRDTARVLFHVQAERSRERNLSTASRTNRDTYRKINPLNISSLVFVTFIFSRIYSQLIQLRALITTLATIFDGYELHARRTSKNLLGKGGIWSERLGRCYRDYFSRRWYVSANIARRFSCN